MSCKSALYVVNTNNAVGIANGGLYSPDKVIRRFGKACQLAGNTIFLNEPGYYDIAVSATVTGLTAATPVTISVYQDNAPVPGLTSTQTISAANDVVTLNTSGIVRVMCNNRQSYISIIVSGQAVTGNNLAVDITKQ
nr:MAG TPA: hypothetical protein [Caudoviricetes sp.]